MLLQTIFLIKTSRTASPVKMLMPVLNFSDHLLQDAFIVFQNSVGNVVHKV